MTRALTRICVQRQMSVPRMRRPTARHHEFVNIVLWAHCAIIEAPKRAARVVVRIRRRLETISPVKASKVMKQLRK